MSNAIMNPTNAAAYLSLREGAIVRLAREGMIPYRRIGRRLIFVRAELELWLSQLPGVCVADADTPSAADRGPPGDRVDAVCGAAEGSSTHPRSRARMPLPPPQTCGAVLSCNHGAKGVQPSRTAAISVT
jgi:excisionase family DNA binding protein